MRRNFTNFFLAVAANASLSLAKFELQTLFRGGKERTCPQEFVLFLYSAPAFSL
jgi:hypothetical protein